MVYHGPSKGCKPCRTRRIKVCIRSEPVFGVGPDEMLIFAVRSSEGGLPQLLQEKYCLPRLWRCF